MRDGSERSERWKMEGALHAVIMLFLMYGFGDLGFLRATGMG